MRLRFRTTGGSWRLSPMERKGHSSGYGPFDQVRAQPLTGTDGATYPFWAPDGRAVGFFADGKLKRIHLTAGTVQVLADAPVGRGGTWNANGVIVFSPSPNEPLSCAWPRRVRPLRR